MDRLEAMSVFAAIVDGGSLSAAGRRLNVPLATVSRKLADLEAHLKTPRAPASRQCHPPQFNEGGEGSSGDTG